jgi:CRP-like cAMP-binding protein
MDQLDIRSLVKSLCPTVTMPSSAILFREGDAAECVYLIHSGTVELIAGDQVVGACGPNDAFGFMSILDSAPRALTVRAKEDTLVSLIDRSKFRFLVHEHPHFPFYVMQQMARRIKGMGAIA